jgi:thioredoxin 1
MNITDQNFQEFTKEGVTLVDFWAAWCGPCQILGPVIEEIATEQEGKSKVAKLNVDENQQTASAFGVMSIPTVILFKDGQEINRFIGVQPKEKYSEAISQALNS